ncbi:MFS general substrate transporter [Imleria badia]|nr:MFS general substrate transporter [Imleria badia]
MSSSNQAPSEATVPFLADSRQPAQLSRSLTWKQFEFSPQTLLIPVTFATTLAAGIPSTTFIELIRQAVCRLWNESHGEPAILTAGGPTPPPSHAEVLDDIKRRFREETFTRESIELCDAPEIAQFYAIVLAILGATEGIMSIAGCGIFSRISSHYGRKPAFLIVLIPAIISSCMIAWSQHVPDWLTGWVFLAGTLFGVFSGPLGYLVDMYILDGCASEDRTAALSKIAGWTGLGACVSLALGGSITTKTGNPVIVFYMATAIYATTLIYVVYFLPESFSEKKRSALSHMRSKASIDGLSATTCLAPLHIFEPLKMLIPTRRMDGTRNWRLTWCAAHTFLFGVANSYALSAWLVLATSKYHFTPADTGLLLTVVTLSSTIFLMVIVPLLLRFLRPYYCREIVCSFLAEEETTNCEELESEPSDDLHIHLTVASCIIRAVSFLILAASTTNRALLFSGICIGISSVHGPTIRSLVAGSVDPLKQGDALAAIEMVTKAGSFLSPIVMGSILTATIGTAPLFVFYVHLVVVLISSTLLFLVKDEDRYQKTHEA